MPNGLRFYRRSFNEVVAAEKASKVFPNWYGESERWLFLSPHDDDTVLGAGLTVLAACAEGIEAHIVVASDGSMGYCSAEERCNIAEIRQRETAESCRLLGLGSDRVHFLGFPDGSLMQYSGRRLARPDDVGVVEGYVGLQNSFTQVLRQVKPTRIFIPTSKDLHPDHQVVSREMLISIFHAQGAIWPELGEPMANLPEVYEYATYSDFVEPPQIKVRATPEMLQRKLAAIAAFASQKQIGLIVEQMREGGPVEYLHEMHFQFYSPSVYENLF
ncbi:MAG TPA: PIG-L family deacetylase [Candidatus Sumerlaeota bacterium]|nr:PIG-L family deacetylase [Candidatus Sumerlaeota bacterium]